MKRLLYLLPLALLLLAGCKEKGSFSNVEIGESWLCRLVFEDESFKDYLTPLLYYKRLSDTWDEEYAAALCGPAPLLGRLKELWGYLHRSFEEGDDGLRRIQHAADPDALFSAVEALTGRPARP